ncbi:MAG: hypothetical protein RIA63_15620 [Cyclobacteriaceae bacterium]
MKYIKPILFSILLCAIFSSYAQPVKQLWTKSVPEGVKWQTVTSLGNYVVGSSQGLIGMNPDNGEVLWKNTKFGAVNADQVKQIGSSPLLAVNFGTTVYVVDPFTGDVKFDSKNAGISEIKDQQVLYRSNGILVSGRDAANKDILLMSSLADGKVAWKIEDDFGRFVTASELPSNELLIVTRYYN